MRLLPSVLPSYLPIPVQTALFVKLRHLTSVILHHVAEYVAMHWHSVYVVVAFPHHMVKVEDPMDDLKRVSVVTGWGDG